MYKTDNQQGLYILENSTQHSVCNLQVKKTLKNIDIHITESYGTSNFLFKETLYCFA